MDLRYWKCPKGHVSVQNFESFTCYCSSCKKDYKWHEGTETNDPKPPSKDDPNKLHPYG